MVRISKQAERRQQSRRRCKAPSVKTGPREENLPQGFKPLKNAVSGDLGQLLFIGKVKNV